MKWIQVVLFSLITLPAFAERSLSWDEVRVQATLTEDGTLRIRERQTYVFDGDWNGGERTFRLGQGQALNFESISRLQADGTLLPLQQGSLDEVDHYQQSENGLRWRSRLPSDPPFANERITYVLEYAISGVLEKRGDRYNLSHDFLFPDRSGEIRRFVLDLDLGTSWRAAPEFETHRELGPLPPGRSVVVDTDLAFTGAVAPETRVSTMPLRLGLAALVLVAPVLMWGRLVHREQQLGRFAPVDAAAVTPGWIEENVLPIAPEVIGAAWDEEVGANEVSALLARWAGEHKIDANAASDKELKMHLRVPRETFTGYERELVDKLFFNGDSTTSSAIRAHYRDKGFSPSSIISRHVQEKADALAPMKEPAPPINRWISPLLFIASLLLIGLTLMKKEDGRLIALAAIPTFLWFIGMAIAVSWRGRIDWGLRQARWLQGLVGLVVLVAVLGLLRDWMHWPAHFGVTAYALFIASNLFNIAKSKKGPAAIAYRKRLAAVRQYFIEELKTPQPAIDDRWFPYVIAFGLDQQATAWSTDVAGRSVMTTSRAGSSSSSFSSSSSSSPRWTGGGGAFGGAGASGSWAAAASGVAAGVASSSSSSSGGGGGGGGRSGGGGGGGW